LKIFSSHFRGAKPPVLVPEGFSLWAALFGWLWLLVHRAWVPAALVFTLSVLATRATAWLASPGPLIGLFLLQGLLGRDLQRWGLSRLGYVEGPVVAAADPDAAFARLFDNRPDLERQLAGAAR